jgi:ribulose-phosphate 3-epimerase
MRAYVSLWSADPLAIRDVVRLVAAEADGFHLDVFDGHNVPELLFGTDFVAALRAETEALLDVHLNVEDPDYWAQRFIAAGADMITVQLAACPDPGATLSRIADAGVRTGIGLELERPAAELAEFLGDVDRVLVMATSLGVRGAELDERTFERIGEVAAGRGGDAPEIVVDGGIRDHTVARLAAAGADGVVPGSLVLGAADPLAALRSIHDLGPETAAGAR